MKCRYDHFKCACIHRHDNKRIKKWKQILKVRSKYLETNVCNVNSEFKTVAIMLLGCLTTWKRDVIYYETYFSKRSDTRSAAIPDPFMMITGSLFCSALDMCSMVLKSPSQTMIATGTGISTIMFKLSTSWSLCVFLKEL